MRRLYLIGILILVANYVFFVDSFKNEIVGYKAEIEKLNILSKTENDPEKETEILELTGIEIIENIEHEILRKNLTSINKFYSQSSDVSDYKLHEMNFILEGKESDFRKFIQSDIFEEEYNLKEASIYFEEEKELMRVVIIVRTL